MDRVLGALLMPAQGDLLTGLSMSMEGIAERAVVVAHQPSDLTWFHLLGQRVLPAGFGRMCYPGGMRVAPWLPLPLQRGAALMAFRPFWQVTPVLSSAHWTGHSLWVLGRGTGWALRSRGQGGELLGVCVCQDSLGSGPWGERVKPVWVRRQSCSPRTVSDFGGEPCSSLREAPRRKGSRLQSRLHINRFESLVWPLQTRSMPPGRPPWEPSL